VAISTSTTFATNILNEILAQRVIAAPKPKNILINHVNVDSIYGGHSLSKEYPVYSDLGAAATATEGTDFSTITTLSYASTITVTPTEAAVALAQVTDRGVRREAGGPGDVAAAFASHDQAAMLRILEPHAMRMGNMVFEKLETDLQALLDDFSDTAGSTGNDLTVANMLTAIYKIKENETEHDDYAFFLHPQQVADLRTALIGASGLTGVVWTSQADASLVNSRRDLDMSGFAGSFLGIPVFELSPSPNPLPNSGADVAGALMCRGVGAPDVGQVGAIVMLEGKPLEVVCDYDVTLRAAEVLVVWEYAVAEIKDSHGVSIITDAP
jgi:hypothetical protein